MMQTRSQESGFSLVEVVIASGILATGLLSMAGFLAIGMTHMTSSSPALIAREKAREAVESVHTARDTGELLWARINNVGTGQGIFVTGFKSLRGVGNDGLANTADDLSQPIESFRSPGRDGLLNTSDDVLTPLTNYERQIQITALNRDGTQIVNPNLRQVTVTVRYKVGDWWRTYTLTTYVSSYS